MPEIEVAALPRLSPAEYRRVEEHLEKWKREVLAAARAHPAKSYELGREQAAAFLRLAGHLPNEQFAAGDIFGGEAPTKRAALQWLRTYTLHELEATINQFLDKVRSAILYGTTQAANPTQVASWLYRATQEAHVAWRLVARTEMVRANAAGRLDAAAAMGYDRVWAPPHVGACRMCKALIENRIFSIDEVRDVTNFGRRPSDWVPCIPLHPQCRHVWVPYVESVYQRMQAEYKALADNGLTDSVLNGMFDSSGQIKPEFADDPRLAAYFAAGKCHDPYAVTLQKCLHDEATVRKGYFDNPQAGLDPLVWERRQLRGDVRERITRWIRHTFGDDALDWIHPYITGSITSPAWAGNRRPGDLDVQLVVNYTALRKAHHDYAALSDPELQAALVTQAKATLAGFEVANGLPMDAFVRPEHTDADFAFDVEHANQPVWDVVTHSWLVPPSDLPVSETVANEQILEGLGGKLAVEHPEWVEHATRLASDMEAALTEYELSARDETLRQLQDAYTFVHDLRQREFAGGLGNLGVGQFIWQYLMQWGPLARVKHLLEHTTLAKTWPDATVKWPQRSIWQRAAATVFKTDSPQPQGTEHWITIHPHGDEEKGIPVLIRENGDGTATVIGGAGGHLNFLRISGKGRMKDPAVAGQKPDRKQQPGEVSEEMADAARQHKEMAQSQLKESQQRIEDAVRSIIKQRGAMAGGEQVSWDQLGSGDRKDLIQRAIQDSLYQSTYGGLADRDRAEAPSGPIVVTPAPRVKDESGAEPQPAGPQEAQDGDDEGEPTDTPAKPAVRPRLALSTEEADRLYEEVAAASALRKRVREANKVLAGEKRPADATELDWQPIDRTAEAERRAAHAAQTDVNRELLGHVEKDRSRKKSLVSEAVQRGAFDAFDSLSYSVFGKSVLPTQLQKLLGVAGTAQLLAHELQQHARAGELDLKQLEKTIDQITDERQAAITRLDLNRARYAAKEAAAMGEELKASAQGQSLFTLTAARSRQAKKLREAAQALGMAVSGSEALHTLRVMLGSPVDKVRVDGYGSRALVKELADKAGVHVTDSNIVRNAAGSYSLHIPAERMSDLLDDSHHVDTDRAALEKIRTGQDLDNAISQAQHPAGYSRTLDRAQAQGSMFLRAAGSGVLAFAPGVGKTDTAIGAAMELMHSKPGTRVLVVAPKTALAGTWAKTIQQTCPGKSLQIIGRQGPAEGAEATHDWEAAGSTSGKKRQAQAEQPADFNLISFDTLKRNPDLVKQLGHTIVIADEAQYAKNETSQRFDGLDQASEGVEHRWALTGTPLEKNMGELHTLANWAKPGQYGSKKQFQDRYGQLNQYDHLTSEEKVQQFRESLSNGVFFQSQNTSTMPPAPELQWEDAPLAPGHTQALQDAVNEFNQQWQDRHEAKARGDQNVPALPAFGGRDAQLAALMKPQSRGYHGPNSRVNKVADLVASNPPVEFAGFKGHPTHADGEAAGTYAPKTVIFGQQTQPLQPIREELERRGTHKVFYTDGSVSDNDQRLAAFLKHKGPAVLITSDTNKTARSLQFGDNGGKFQHGATQMIHADLPLNNADLQQRIARIWRRGAQAPIHGNHILYSDTPVERSARDQLASELRTQQAVGNPEDRVAGRDEKGQSVERETIQQKLRRGGQRRLRRRREAVDG